jgi:hypothetical protein
MCCADVSHEHAAAGSHAARALLLLLQACLAHRLLSTAGSTATACVSGVKGHIANSSPLQATAAQDKQHTTATTPQRTCCWRRLQVKELVQDESSLLLS